MKSSIPPIKVMQLPTTHARIRSIALHVSDLFSSKDMILASCPEWAVQSGDGQPLAGSDTEFS
jgi:hypothetical protein